MEKETVMIATRPNEKALDLLFKVGKFIWQKQEVDVTELISQFRDQRAVPIAKFLVKQGDFAFDGQKFYAKG